jgi:tetratricopeptide (TPR) repeat protein
VRQVVQACDRFEAAWKAGPRPSPENFLTAVNGPARSALLRLLLLLDWDYRQRAGDEPHPADYFDRFPSDQELIGAVGREMSQASVGTRVGLDEHGPTNTPWSGDRAASAPRNSGPAADTDDARYELEREVGQGGIGVVFRGRDRHLGRELAVKVLHEAIRDEPEARKRFFEEARIGSQLQHPAIVPVYEQGFFADGRPYFTMKLVEGHTLAELLRSRDDPRQDQTRLLGMFEQVCQAMAYAHARGVVHRDLKPANVMAGAFGEVQVMDWGFAKVLSGYGVNDAGGSAQVRTMYGRNGVSQSGLLMGTPAYMPPEQARGEATLIDARADVFALGAMLCEMLTGRPPYSGTTADEVCRRAAAGDMGDALARLAACGADAPLRELAQRCLAAERAARPADAGIVAKELTEYLASAQERVRLAEVERAAAQVRVQEVGAKVRAERRARQLTLALAVALLLGGGAAVWQAVAATRAKQEAVTAKEAAEAKDAETQAVLDFVQNRVIAAARPEGEKGGLGHDVTLRQALQAALPAVGASFTRQPLTEARLRLTLGQSFYFLGDAQSAADQCEAALTLYAEHRGPEDPDTLTSMNALAGSYLELGRPRDARPLLEKALALGRTRLGPDHPDTLKTITNLGICYSNLGLHRDALKLYEEALALQRATLGADHHLTRTSAHQLAIGYMMFARYADALPLFEEALEWRRKNLSVNHPDTLNTMSNLAYNYAMLGRHADAVKLTKEVLELRIVKLGPFHRDTLQSMVNLANGYSDLGRHQDALELREQTLELQKVHLPPNHPDTLWSMHNLSNSFAKADRHAEALKLREETLALREAHLGLGHPDTLRSMRSLAETLVQLDRGAEAVPLIDDCVRRSAGKIVHPKLIPGVVDLRLRHFYKVKDAAGCRVTAEIWENLGRTDADSLYAATRYRAVTAAVLRATEQYPAAAQEADAEADRAMSRLKNAVAAGYKDVESLTKDTDLDALRGRADFKALVAELADR